MGYKSRNREIADELTKQIDTGIFQPGCRMPPERELASQFDVSRVVIRHAQIVLQERGLIEVKIGSGMFVLEDYRPNLYSKGKFDLLQLTEARSVIAVETATLAAPIITDQDIKKLQSFVEIIASNENIQTRVEAYADFHNIIASATNNHVIILVAESLWKLRTEVTQLRSFLLRNNQQICADYLSVIDAFKHRNSTTARSVMKAHFMSLIESLLEWSEEQAYEEIKRKTFEKRSRFIDAWQTA